MITAEEARKNVTEFNNKEVAEKLKIWEESLLNKVYEKIEKQSKLGISSIVLSEDYRYMPAKIQEIFLNDGYSLVYAEAFSGSTILKKPQNNVNICSIRW